MNISKIIIAAALSAAMLSGPANAQSTNILGGSSNVDEAGRTPAQVQQVALEMQNELRESAGRLAGLTISSAEYEVPYRGSIGVVNAQADPWKVVTQAQMRETTDDPYFQLPNYSLGVAVDYDKDGKADTARMYNNSKQGAIIVTYSDGRNEVIYKRDEPFAHAIQIFPVGKNRVILSFPEVSQVILEQVGGKPMVYYMGN